MRIFIFHDTYALEIYLVLAKNHVDLLQAQNLSCPLDLLLRQAIHNAHLHHWFLVPHAKSLQG